MLGAVHQAGQRLLMLFQTILGIGQEKEGLHKFNVPSSLANQQAAHRLPIGSLRSLRKLKYCCDTWQHVRRWGLLLRTLLATICAVELHGSPAHRQKPCRSTKYPKQLQARHRLFSTELGFYGHTNTPHMCSIAKSCTAIP